MIAQAADKLMRKIEDQNTGTFDGGFEVGYCDKICRQGNVRQVFDILMLWRGYYVAIGLVQWVGPTKWLISTVSLWFSVENFDCGS